MLDEAKNINKSLSSLGNVISALAEGTVSNSASTLFPCKGFGIVSYCFLWVVSPLGGIRLGRREKSNHTPVQTKTSAPRPLRGGGLGPVPNELWSDGNVIRPY